MRFNACSNRASAERILVPAGGTLDARFRKGAAQGREAAAAGVRAVLEAQAATASGGKFPASSGPARDILIDLLKQTGPNLTWKLLYGPDMREYNLNIVSFPQADGFNGATPGNANR